MKRHELPINEPICSTHLFASSFGGGKPSKELLINTKDNEVFFIVKQSGEIIFRSPNRTDAVSIYNSLP